RTAAPPDPAGAGGAVADPQHAPAAALNRDVCGGEPGHVRVCDEVVDRPGWVRGRRVALGTSQAIRPGRLGVHRFADRDTGRARPTTGTAGGTGSTSAKVGRMVPHRSVHGYRGD